MQLHEIKKQFEKCQHDLRHLHHLLERREIEILTLHELKTSIEEHLVGAHKEGIDTQTEQMAHLKNTIKMIDSEIDALARISHPFSRQIATMAPEIPLRDCEDSVELTRPRYFDGKDLVTECGSCPRKCEKCGLRDEKEQECRALKQRLIEGILTQYPDASKAFTDIEKQIQEASSQIETLDKETKLLHPLFKIIQEGAAINTQFSLLRFLFGKTPRIQLARVADRATDLAENIFQECQDDIKIFLEGCIQKLKNPWSKNFNKESFQSLYCESIQLRESLEKEKQNVVLKLSHQEHCLETWFTKYCNISVKPI